MIENAGNKMSTASALRGGRGKNLQQQENGVNGARNQARGTKWSPSEERGFEYYRSMNKDAKRADFDALPKAERAQYVELGELVGQNSKKSAPTKALASIGDAFTASSELKSEGKKGGSGVGALIGALGKAFA